MLGFYLPLKRARILYKKNFFLNILTKIFINFIFLKIFFINFYLCIFKNYPLAIFIPHLGQSTDVQGVPG